MLLILRKLNEFCGILWNTYCIYIIYCIIIFLRLFDLETLIDCDFEHLTNGILQGQSLHSLQNSTCPDNIHSFSVVARGKICHRANEPDWSLCNLFCPLRREGTDDVNDGGQKSGVLNNQFCRRQKLHMLHDWNSMDFIIWFHTSEINGLTDLIGFLHILHNIYIYIYIYKDIQRL